MNAARAETPQKRLGPVFGEQQADIAFIRSIRVLFAETPGAYLPFANQVLAMALALLPNKAFVEQGRDELKIVEDFIGSLGELDRQTFTMYLDDLSYAEISAATGVDEANLRKRMSRIKMQYKAKYNGS